MIDPEITTISIYRKDKKKLRAIAIANDLRDLKNHPSMQEAAAGRGGGQQPAGNNSRRMVRE